MALRRGFDVETAAPTRALVRPGPAGRIGLIALATDNTSESDLRAMLPADAALFVTRIGFANPVTAESLAAMREDIPVAAGLLVPGTPLDAVIFGCTSGTAMIGEAEVARLIRAGRGDVAAVTPLGAVRRALAAVGAKRVCLLTPYTTEVTRPICDWLVDEGFDIARAACLELDDDVAMASLDPLDIVEAGLAVDDPAAEALFVSCTALPAARFVASLEKRLGKPVIASNQALAWQAMRIAGATGDLPGPGYLMTCHMPGEAAA